MDFDNSVDEIKRQYDKSSFFVGCDNRHGLWNMIKRNEIILRMIILRVIIRRGSRIKDLGKLNLVMVVWF